MTASCSICSQLGDTEYATQKHGWPEDDTHLPAAANALRVVANLRQDSDRQKELRRCPECKAYYLYETDYEFLAGGSEDEQSLRRITDAEAAAYL